MTMRRLFAALVSLVLAVGDTATPAQRQGSDMSANGTLLSGAGSMFSRFSGLDKRQGLFG